MRHFKRSLCAIDVLISIGFVTTCIVLTITSSSSSLTTLENLGVKSWIRFVCATCLASLVAFATTTLSRGGMIFFCPYYVAAIVCVLTEKEHFSSNALIIILSSMVFLLSLHAIALFLDTYPTPTTTTTTTRLTEPLLVSVKSSSSSSSLKQESSKEVEEEDDDDEAVQLSKQHNQKEKKSDYGTRQLLELTKPHSNMLWISCAVLLVRLPLSLSIPHWVAETIGDLSQGNYSSANWNVLYLVLCGTGDAVLDFWVYYLFGLVQQSIIRDLRLDLFRALLRMEIGFFDANKTGEITSRLTSDTAEMANDLTWVFRFSLEALVRIGGTISYMLVRSWRLGLLAIAIVPITAIVNRYYARFLRQNQKSVQTALAGANVVATECVSSIRLVRSFNTENQELAKYSSRILTHFSLMMKQIFYTSGYYMVCNTFLINTVVQASILAYGAYLISENLVSSRILLAFMLYQGILQEYTQNLLNSFTSLIKSSGAAAKVFEYIKRVPKCQGGMSRVDNDDDDVVIAYENVRFCYPNRPETLVLKGIDLKIPRGSVVALVGPSGAGKSTLFHLLQHYYEPQLGYVRLNGLNVSKILHSSLHAYISLVSQEPVLMSGTILENILYGVSESRRRELGKNGLKDLAVRSAKAANAHRFVTEELEGKYETLVGEKGAQLSGGQKQRVAIARCLAIEPDVLLLDEATSALDAESEAIVQEALDRVMIHGKQRKRTTMVIAHRLSTVRRADMIVVMCEGKIVQTGTHDELMRRKDDENKGFVTYRSLVRRQVFEAGGVGGQSDVSSS